MVVVMVVVVVSPARYEEEGRPRGTCCEPKAGFPPRGSLLSCAARVLGPVALFFANGPLQFRGRGRDLKLVGINSPPFRSHHGGSAGCDLLSVNAGPIRLPSACQAPRYALTRRRQGPHDRRDWAAVHRADQPRQAGCNDMVSSPFMTVTVHGRRS